MAHAGPGADRLRMLAVVLVSFAASGLIVLASSHAAFDSPAPKPPTPTPSPSPIR